MVQWTTSPDEGCVLADECPSDEVLAAYIDHVLSPAERARIETHLVACKPCRQTVALVIKSRSAVPDPHLPGCPDA